MIKRTYTEKIQTLNDWVAITNYHWERLNGQFYNDAEAWDQTLHAMREQDWWDWVEVEPALRAQYPDSFQRYPYISQGTEHINKALMFGKALIKKDVTGANFNTFRAWMNIKDVINDINGTPTKEYPKPVDVKKLPVKEQKKLAKKAKVETKTEIFSSLFEFGA